MYSILDQKEEKGNPLQQTKESMYTGARQWMPGLENWGRAVDSCIHVEL